MVTKVRKKQNKNLRTARLAVSVATQDAQECIGLLRRFSEELDLHCKNLDGTPESRRKHAKGIDINISAHDLGKLKGVLRDYITLRISNIVDSHTSALSLKDFEGVDVDKICKIPEVAQVLDSRNNWIGHINKRFIGPVDINVLTGSVIGGLLSEINYSVCTESVREKK